ncbi:MAG: TlpA family protein disulfide reductase [Saprospiraceae bacterium]|nr:TlpA family protein disulfide reductase [Saprospiraceae bacterium]
MNFRNIHLAMRNLAVLIFCLFVGAVHAQQTCVTLLPLVSAPEQPVKISLDLQCTSLRNASGPIGLVVLEYNGETTNLIELPLLRVGDKLEATYQATSKAQAAMAGFYADEVWENNAGEGYFWQAVGADGKPTAESFAARAVLYRSQGSKMELNRKATVAMDDFQKAFKSNPDLQVTHLNAYLNALFAVKKGDEGKAEALVMMEAVEKNPKATEKELLVVANYYDRLTGTTQRGQALRDKLIKAHPAGATVRAERMKNLRSVDDFAERAKQVEAFERDFPAQNQEEKDAIDRNWADIAGHYADKKDWTKFNAACDHMHAKTKMSVYNNVAWELAEKGDDLPLATKLAAEATAWARNETMAPSVEKPTLYTQQEWMEFRRGTLGMNADTYAYILDKTGDFQGAARLQAEVVGSEKGHNAEYNERYTQYLEKSKSPMLRHALEGFLIAGYATQTMRDQFKKLYASEDKSAEGTEAYLASLDKQAYDNRKEEVARKMISQPAPAFSLKNLKGETVSLESLRGKVVVIDFWATWCGPCKASFPGMQKSQEQHKNDPQVAYVFIDCWEKGDAKEKNASEFIKSKNYPFNVLMDNEDKVVASYGVSGIPTKFVVDKNGNIRFKSVGFGGEESLVQELGLMIDLAKAQP